MRRVEKLWERSPFCRRCGKPTVIEWWRRQSIALNVATVQHRYSKDHPHRSKGNKTTLFCRGCNAEDNKMMQSILNKKRKGISLSDKEIQYYRNGGDICWDNIK